MNVLEAYNLTMDKITSLKNKGIKVKQVAPTHKPTNLENSTIDHIHFNLWNHITFVPKTEKEWRMVYAAGRELHSLGIYFDTGNGSGERDWEIDWSFHLFNNK
jgi:hypothetical protein